MDCYRSLERPGVVVYKEEYKEEYKYFYEYSNGTR